ncbi:hypothetical protein [Secundilactobacillus collinoides]|nr:hypothetical protein [Secundilactobacillus collinoides]KZL41715.1 hypothetical protein TY91_05720 [Secundilactobacillus collinoides]
MSEDEIITELKRLLSHMRLMSVFQVTADTFMLYGLIVTLLAKSGTVAFLGAVLTQSHAIAVVVLLGLIDLCFTGIRYNDRRTGAGLIEELGDSLSDEAEAIVAQFKRYK